MKTKLIIIFYILLSLHHSAFAEQKEHKDWMWNTDGDEFYFASTNFYKYAKHP